MGFVDPDTDALTESLSARRAWIEISLFLGANAPRQVALRKESVDRNFSVLPEYARLAGRSPQGERG